MPTPRLSAISIVFALASGFAFASLASCTPQEPGDGGGDSPADEVDAAPVAGPDAGPAPVCEETATQLPNPKHNAGLACLSCHSGTGVAPKWTVAGTLFTNAQGSAPIAGATVLITDANGVTTKLVTASNGNFYTSKAMAFPVRVGASKCPDTKMMPGMIMTGDCNSCHQAATTGRIHLP